jgi:type VI protein secretion system component VasF
MRRIKTLLYAAVGWFVLRYVRARVRRSVDQNLGRSGSRQAPSRRAAAPHGRRSKGGDHIPLWAIILIIVLAVLVIGGGYGYGRR